jgi:hypothetical protein
LLKVRQIERMVVISPGDGDSMGASIVTHYRLSVRGKADIEFKTVASVIQSERKRRNSIFGDPAGGARATVAEKQRWDRHRRTFYAWWPLPFQR